MIAITLFMPQHHRGNLIEMIKKSVTAKDYWLPRLLQPFPKRVIESKLKIKTGRYSRSIQIFKACLFMPCLCLRMRIKAQLTRQTHKISRRYLLFFMSRKIGIVHVVINCVRDRSVFLESANTRFQEMKRTIENDWKWNCKNQLFRGQKTWPTK